jgi:hypothetical protein
MMDADGVFGHAGADLALVLQRCEINLAVAHVAVPGGLAFADRGALEPKRLLVEIGGGLDVLDESVMLRVRAAVTGSSKGSHATPYCVGFAGRGVAVACGLAPTCLSQRQDQAHNALEYRSVARYRYSLQGISDSRTSAPKGIVCPSSTEKLSKPYA